MKLKIQRLDKDLPLPKYAYTGDVALDLLSREDFSIKPNERKSISTGLAFEIPDGYAGLIWDKSGLSQKKGLKTLGGVVDSNYRGEIFVGLVNMSDEVVEFERGNKIAQMIIQKVEVVEIEEVEELNDTERGDKAFGSSGK